MELFIALLTVGVGLLFATGLVVSEVVFRRDEVGQWWRAVLEAEEAAKKRWKAVVSRVQRDEQDFKMATRRYEQGYIGGLVRRRPIRDLRPYVSVSMSWAALERAGITNLEQFLAFRGDFGRIHGIGEARSRALRSARRQLQQELRETTLPMPTVRRPGTPEFDVVAKLVRVVDLRTEVAPRIEAVEEQGRALRDERPGFAGVRWQFWVGDRDGLQQELASICDRWETLRDGDLAELEHSEQRAGLETSDPEKVVEIYGEHQEVAKRVIDSLTQREVRGAVRPVGAAAMRAAEGFDDEEDFCDRGLEPLIDKLGYRHQREFTIKRRIGSRDKTLYVDFLLLNDRGRKVAILEAKRNIRNDRELDDARQQALSYALFEELAPMMVAAPEGLWLYERRGQETRFCAKYEMAETYEKVDELRRRIEGLRG